MSKRTFKICIAIIIICFIFIFYCLTILLIFNRNLELEYKKYTYIQYTKAKQILENELFTTRCQLTDQEFKSYIEQEFNLHFYIYTEKDLGDKYDGQAYPLIRTIAIDNELNGYGYCKTFVHETIHIKHMACDERYVCFETFKYLYENEKLHDVGVWYGDKQVKGCYSGQYNISDLVIDYLTNK